jgi:hypothetical protein
MCFDICGDDRAMVIGSHMLVGFSHGDMYPFKFAFGNDGTIPA